MKMSWFDWSVCIVLNYIDHGEWLDSNTVEMTTAEHKSATSCELLELSVFCWSHGSSFKDYSIVVPVPWLAKVESSQKSNGMWFFRHFFVPDLFHCSRINRRNKLRSKFWREKMFRKPDLKPLRWCSVRGTNNLQFWSTKIYPHNLRVYLIFTTMPHQIYKNWSMHNWNLQELGPA